MSSRSCTDAEGTTWQIWRDGNGRWHWRAGKSGGQSIKTGPEAGFPDRDSCIASAIANGMNCTPKAEFDPEIESKLAADADTDPGSPSP